MYPSTLAEQCVYTCTQSIHAAAEDVFPLLCPMREHEWIPDWRARMIHSRSVVAEPGSLFASDSDIGETLWVVTTCTPPRSIQFVRFQPDGVVVVIDIDVATMGDGSAQVHIRYAFTASTPDAGDAVRAFTPDHWTRMMRRWESLMNEFLAARAIPSQ